MTEERLSDYLDHMRQAETNACNFVEGFSKDDFLDDIKTQQVVIMSLIIIGKAASKIMTDFPDFAGKQHYPNY